MRKGQPHVYPKDLIPFDVPFYCAQDQLKIVSILEEIDDLRQKQRKAIELTRQMIPALFYEMFGDIESNEKGFDRIKLQDVTTINPQDLHLSIIIHCSIYIEQIKILNS